MATIYIGTSGYSYTEWVGPVYPEGTRSCDFLSLYSTEFPTVELNFSYYRMPRKEQLQKMSCDVPQSFKFSIKAHESLTHTVDFNLWQKNAGQFRDALEIPADNGQLAAVLFQFPYSFHYETDRRRYLDALLREFSSYPLAVEFRNSKWYNSRTIEALKNRDIALTSLDLPQAPRTPPIMDVHTSRLSYIRLHGRNRENWWGSDAANRYDYLYSTKELEAIASRIRAVAAYSESVLVYFNNHRRGQAVQGARELGKILRIR